MDFMLEGDITITERERGIILYVLVRMLTR